MLIALVLICSIAATPDLSDCTRENATTVMRVPGEIWTSKQLYYAGPSLFGSNIRRSGIRI